MTPSHSEAMAAAKRVQTALERGDFGDIDDTITMHLYQLSAELRLVPRDRRGERAREVARLIIRNTGESME